MGQQCSVLTCRHVEHPDGMAEMSRMDSPDPVMYDLMRKSIQATTAMQQNKDNECSQETTANSKPGKNSKGPVGQAHLLYRNSSKSSSARDILAGKKQQQSPSSSFKSEKKMEKRARESRSGGGNSNTNNKTGNAEVDANTSWDVTTSEESDATTLRCPTRLLIRRRSLRIVEEGGGTHIYAIRYPEDTSKMILSEQAQPLSPIARQEQCPPRRNHKSTMPATTAAARSASSATSTPTPPISTTPTADKDTKQKNAKNKKKAERDNTTDKPRDTADQSQNDKNHAQPGTDAGAKTALSDLPAFLAKPENAGEIFSAACMTTPPKRNVVEWVTVSEEHNIYVADIGLMAEECDEVVATTEQVCRGQYAAYTYAKQTLGCREFPILAHASFHPVHTIVHSIINKFPLEDEKDNDDAAQSKTFARTSSKGTNNSNDNDRGSKSGSNDIKKDLSASKSEEGVEIQRQLQLDDREPHIVKYDVTRKERQKLDMHTDKSEWTFLIALSNGCGVDYEGGGTYFECLDATVHIQRGHALVFPGKLRHCGQKITSGLRFLLVGFLVDKQSTTTPAGKTAVKTVSKSSTKTNTSSDSTTQKSSTCAAKDNNQVIVAVC